MTAPANEAVTSRANAWHQSSLEAIVNGCSWQWALVNVLRLPDPPKPASEAGTAVHAAIEAHELARKKWYDTDGKKGRKTGITIEAAKKIAVKHLNKTVPLIPERLYPVDKKTGVRMEPEFIYVMANNAIEAWWEAKPKGEKLSNRDWLLDYRPVVIEPYFNEVLLPETRPIGGWVDGIYRHLETNRLTVVDEKTAKDFSRWASGTHRLQATMYTVATVLSDDYDVDDLRDVDFWYLVNRTMTGKTATFQRSRRMQVTPDLTDVQELGDMIREAQRVFDEEDYVKNPGWGPLCSVTYCPFFKECMITGELSKPYRELKKEYGNE